MNQINLGFNRESQEQDEVEDLGLAIESQDAGRELGRQEICQGLSELDGDHSADREY